MNIFIIEHGEKKKYRSGLLTAKKHNKQYILEAGKNVTNFTGKTDNFPVSD